MRCPCCGGHIAAVRALSNKSRLLKCDLCNHLVHVKGILIFLIVPTLLFFFFPFGYLPDNSLLLAITLLAAILASYVTSFLLFVRLICEKTISIL